MLIDKINFLENQHEFVDIEIEIGCGNRKKHKHALGIDLINAPGVDIVGDALSVLSRVNDKSVKSIYAYHFLEHINDVERYLVEFERVMIAGGNVEIVVPHFSSPYFYSDPTHKTFFGLYSMCYFTSAHPFMRKVPIYGRALGFKVDSVRLGFKAERPFYIRYAIRQVIGALFNSSNYLKELYEDVFSNVFSCYEVCYTLSRN